MKKKEEKRKKEKRKKEKKEKKRKKKKRKKKEKNFSPKKNNKEIQAQKIGLLLVFHLDEKKKRKKRGKEKKKRKKREKKEKREKKKKKRKKKKIREFCFQKREVNEQVKNPFDRENLSIEQFCKTHSKTSTTLRNSRKAKTPFVTLFSLKNLNYQNLLFVFCPPKRKRERKERALSSKTVCMKPQKPNASQQGFMLVLFFIVIVSQSLLCLGNEVCGEHNCDYNDFLKCCTEIVC